MTHKKINVIDLKIKFEHEVLYLKEYIDFNVKEQNIRLKKIARLLQEEIDEDKKNESILKMVYQDDFIKLPSFFYHSTIVTIYSLLESTLLEICERAKNDLKLKLSVNDFATKDNLGKSAIYLEKLINVDFYKENKEWNHLIDFRTLRNIIVHQNSRFVAEPTKAEKELIKRLNYIQINPTDFTFYVTDSKLIITFLNLISKKLDDIFTQLEFKEFRLMEIIDKDPFGLPF